jgi:hypothetical protein
LHQFSATGPPWRVQAKPSVCWAELHGWYKTHQLCNFSALETLQYRDVGHRKTRLAAAWAKHRGISTSHVKRGFAPDFTAGGDEPSMALIRLELTFLDGWHHSSIGKSLLINQWLAVDLRIRA